MPSMIPYWMSAATDEDQRYARSSGVSVSVSRAPYASSVSAPTKMNHASRRPGYRSAVWTTSGFHQNRG